MRHPKEHIWMTLLLLTAVLSAFYMRGQTARPVSAIPVQRVFVAVSPTPLPAGFRQQREAQRREEVAALTALASQDSQAAERLRRLLETADSLRGWGKAVFCQPGVPLLPPPPPPPLPLLPVLPFPSSSTMTICGGCVAAVWTKNRARMKKKRT